MRLILTAKYKKSSHKNRCDYGEKNLTHKEKPSMRRPTSCDEYKSYLGGGLHAWHGGHLLGCHWQQLR